MTIGRTKAGRRLPSSKQPALRPDEWKAITPSVKWISAAGDGYYPLAYRIAGDTVELRGGVVAQSGAANPMFTLPAEARPAEIVNMNANREGIGGNVVEPAILLVENPDEGKVEALNSITDGDRYTFDGVSFVLNV